MEGFHPECFHVHSSGHPFACETEVITAALTETAPTLERSRCGSLREIALRECPTVQTLWRNGSASDSRSEGCVFKSRQGQRGNLQCMFFVALIKA